MTEYQKRHIAVSPQERRQLEEGKRRYEGRAGHTDWGRFLAVATGVGLAALGIYALVRASQRNSTTWQVTCPNRDCGATFPIVADSPPQLAQVACPNCNTELLVDFASVLTSADRQNWHTPGLRSGRTINMNCAGCGREMEVTVTAGDSPQGVTYLQCPFCGTVATYGIGRAQREGNGG
jgi:DNA-directed RNA polymerase subunit RPC12/RpoP